MSDILKIALTGKMRSGKDEIARHLWLRHGFKKLAFGDELKRIFHELNPWIPESPKPRAEYQRFGQEMRRIYGDDIWIKHVEYIATAIENNIRTNGLVISDLRQPNEHDWCKRNGFVIVRVTAPDEIRLERAKQAGDIFEADDLAHETESYVDSFDVDYEIINDGSLDELYAQVDEVMREITKGGGLIERN